MCDKVEYLKIAGAVILPLSQGLVHTDKATYEKNHKEWYPKLKFPSYKPSPLATCVVWGGLYSSMGYASYLVYKSGGGFNGNTSLALSLYGTQLAMNWAWYPIFFKHKELGWATVNMGTVLAAASATTYAFYKINPTAAYILLPYLGWLAFSLNVNYQVWKLNKDRKLE